MTNEWAIRLLIGDVLGTAEQTQEAVTMAVRALSQPDVTDTNVEDTISRQAAIDSVRQYCIDNQIEDGDYHANGIEYELNSLPSIRPKGKWIDITKCGGASFWKCSECGELFLEDFYFCPNCGAEMEVE